MKSERWFLFSSFLSVEYAMNPMSLTEGINEAANFQRLFFLGSNTVGVRKKWCKNAMANFFSGFIATWSPEPIQVLFNFIKFASNKLHTSEWEHISMRTDSFEAKKKTRIVVFKQQKTKKSCFKFVLNSIDVKSQKYCTENIYFSSFNTLTNCYIRSYLCNTGRVFDLFEKSD